MTCTGKGKGGVVAAIDLRWQPCPAHSSAAWLLLLLSEQTDPDPPVLLLWTQFFPFPPGNQTGNVESRIKKRKTKKNNHCKEDAEVSR